MTANRKDYGPAGCMDGCAQSGGCGCLMLVVGCVLALLGVRRKGRAR